MSTGSTADAIATTVSHASSRVAEAERETHLDVEVLRIVEDGANVFGLRLHVHLLNLTVLQRCIAVGSLLGLVLGESRAQGGLGRLQGGSWKRRS